MSDILSTLSNAIYPGQRVLRFAGWEGLKKFHMPRDSEVIGLDVDPTKSYIYMKKVDAAGNEFCGRYSYYEDPVEEFTPGAYVRKSDFDKFKEEVINAINSRHDASVSPATVPANPEHPYSSSAVPGFISRTDASGNAGSLCDSGATPGAPAAAGTGAF